MGADTSVVIALIFVGFLTLGTLSYSILDHSRNLVKKAEYDRDDIKKNKIQTDITIMNITNSTQRLNITLKNTGKTTLNASALNIFFNGNLYSDYSILSTGNNWPSETQVNISLYPVTYSPDDRIKIITENGIADYVLVP